MPVPELLIAVATVGLLGVVTARAAVRKRAAVVAPEVVAKVVHRAREAVGVDDALRHLLDGLATATGATRADALFVTPPNKAVARVSLEDGQLTTIETRPPEELCELMTAWLAVDPRPADLREGDAHPLRPWLAQMGVDDAIVVPLMDSEPLGVIVLGNRLGGPAGATTLDGPRLRQLAADATAALLGARRRELLARMPAAWFDTTGAGIGSSEPLDMLPAEDVLRSRLDMVEAAREEVALVSLRVHPVRGRADVGLVADAVAERLMRTVRRVDLTARVGDDRVVVVLAEVADSDIALRTAQRLVDRAHAPVLLDGVVVRPEVSAGVVLWDGHTRVSEIREELDAVEAAAAIDPMHALHLRASARQRRGLAA